MVKASLQCSYPDWSRKGMAEFTVFWKGSGRESEQEQVGFYLPSRISRHIPTSCELSKLLGAVKVEVLIAPSYRWERWVCA